MEKRFLQATVLIASIVPIGAGLAGIIAPPYLFGAYRYSIDFINHFGYLSGLLLAIGIIFAVSVPHIERHQSRFLILGIIIVCGGLARLYECLMTGFGSAPNQMALVMELIVTPAIVFWQRRFSAKSTGTGAG